MVNLHFPRFSYGFPMVFPFSQVVFLWFSHFPMAFPMVKTHGFSTRLEAPDGHHGQGLKVDICGAAHLDVVVHLDVFLLKRAWFMGCFFVFWKGLCVFLMKTWELGEVRDFFCGLKRAVFFYGEEILDLGKGILVGKISKKRLIGLEYGDCLFVF